jgi:hypothetical protein
MAESNSRTTVKSRLSRPLNGVIHQTQRRVSSEYPLPSLGTSMASELGSAYADSIVVAASLTPDLGKEMGVITHAQIPSESAQLSANWEHTTCDIGGMKFDAVTRTVVMLASAYSESSPAIGSALVANPTGAPSLGSGYVLADRQNVISGTELEPVFRVERRSYVKKVSLFSIDPDAQTGIASQITRTLYYRGESITFGADTKTIEGWMALPSHAYWATDASGFARTGEQLSDDWFSVSYGKSVDLETAFRKESNRLRPDKFYCPKDVVTTTVTTANNTPGAPDQPVASLGSSISISKVGRIQKTETTTQSGSAQVLKSLELLPADGYIYPSSEELVASSAVPSTRSFINSEGQAITFNNVDACNAVKSTRQAISLENDYQKSVARFVPEKFLENSSVATTEETETGVAGEPGAPVAEDRKQITVKQKGVVRTTETRQQLGTLKVLKSADLLTDDGHIYESTEQVVPASEAIGGGKIDSDGKVVTFSNIDAHWAVKSTRQAVSLKNENQRSSSRLAPDRFFQIAQKSVVETTEAGVVGDPITPAVSSYQEATVVQKGAIRKTTTTTQPGNPVALRGTSVERRTGETFLETTELVPASSVFPTSVDTDGTVVIFEPIDANWAMKISRRAASTLAKTWTTDIEFEWPTVLLGISFKTWARKGGAGSVVYPVPRFKKGFYEHQTATVTQYWQKAQPTIIPRPTMVAEGFSYRCPLYSISVPPCLHQSITLSCSIGTNDPDWESASDAETFSATNYTNWPEEIFWRLSEPYLGGFIVTEYRLPRPS